jgi:hypothetical protein
MKQHEGQHNLTRRSALQPLEYIIDLLHNAQAAVPEPCGGRCKYSTGHGIKVLLHRETKPVLLSISHFIQYMFSYIVSNM